MNTIINQIDPYKEFCLYFDELDKFGISWGLSDLFEKSRELGIPPCEETLKWLRSMRK